MVAIFGSHLCSYQSHRHKEFVDKTMNSETLSRDRKKIWSSYLFNSASVNETFSEDDRTRSFDLGIDLSAFCKYGLTTSGLSHSN